MAFEPIKITEDIHWVGAFNEKLRIFDIIMHTEQGTTYNAYLIKGSEKTALVETVKRGFSLEMFGRIEKIMPLQDIDYIVCNHLEPDHSGSIPEALEKMPKAKMVVAKNGAPFLKELTNMDLDPMKVGTGDELDLGGKTLKFITAPFLHWPDTMFTYIPEEQVLLSCDFLGAHYCHEELFVSKAADYSHAFRYYYDHIMRPFKEHVIKGLEAIKDLPIKIVGTSHGPILDESIDEYIQKYREWSSVPKPEPKGKILIFYVSAYGFTGQLAKAVEAGIKETGVKAALFDLVGTELADAIDMIEQADGIAVGSCTINGDAVKPVWDLLSSLATLKIRGKYFIAFGSYGWSGEAVPMMEERMKSLKMKSAATGLRVKFKPRAEDIEAAKALGVEIGSKVKALRSGGA